MAPRSWPSITNIGFRPTFNGQRDHHRNVFAIQPGRRAAEEISVEFLRWVREERKFENAEALKAQILRDVGRAQAYFRRLEQMTAPAR